MPHLVCVGCLASAFLAMASISPKAMAQPVVQQDSGIITYQQACEPSGAAVLSAPGGGRMLVVANDGDNALRAYDLERGGLPQPIAVLDDHLGIPAGERSRRRGRADIEAAAQLGDRVYWIASHSRESDEGELRPNRHRFFATRAELEGGPGGSPQPG